VTIECPEAHCFRFEIFAECLEYDFIVVLFTTEEIKEASILIFRTEVAGDIASLQQLKPTPASLDWLIRFTPHTVKITNLHHIDFF